MGKVIVTRTKEKQKWNCCSRFWFSLLIILLQVLLWGSVGLVLYWVLHYRGGFGWNNEPLKEFNLHPTLMIIGFVFLIGQAILIYRVFRCCRPIYNKLFHTVLHLLAMPDIAIGVMAVFDYHNYSRQNGPIPNLYSLHSWMGLATLGLFGLQFLVGFFSFLVLLCCQGKTANFRASLVPIHAHFGLATFILAIGTCLTGLTEKAFFSMDGKMPAPNSGFVSPTGNKMYKDLPPEGIVVNVLAMTLVGAGIIMSFIIRYPRFRPNSSENVVERL